MKKYDIKRIKQDIKTAEARGVRGALERFGDVRNYGSGYRMVLFTTDETGPLLRDSGYYHLYSKAQATLINQCRAAQLNRSLLYMLRTHVRGHLHARKVWLPTLGSHANLEPTWELQEMTMHIQELLLGNLLKQYELPETLVRAPHLAPESSHQADAQGS